MNPFYPSDLCSLFKLEFPVLFGDVKAKIILKERAQLFGTRIERIEGIGTDDPLSGSVMRSALQCLVNSRAIQDPFESV